MRFAIVTELDEDSGKPRCALRRGAARPARRRTTEVEPENASKGDESAPSSGVIRC